MCAPDMAGCGVRGVGSGVWGQGWGSFPFRHFKQKLRGEGSRVKEASHVAGRENGGTLPALVQPGEQIRSSLFFIQHQKKPLLAIA